MGIEQYNQSVVQLQYLIENNLITPEDAAIMQEKLNETKIQLDATKKLWMRASWNWTIMVLFWLLQLIN